MGLLGFKPALLITVFALLMYGAWGLGNGFVTWQTPAQACFGGYRLVTAVDKQPFFSVGKLTLKYQPWSWTCPKDDWYDPALYEVRNGALVTRSVQSSSQTIAPLTGLGN